MAPVIRISNTTYRRLQALATPFTDTPAVVIERLLDAHATEIATGQPSGEPAVPSGSEGVGEGVIELDVEEPGDLKFTKTVSAWFDGSSAKNWADLVRVACIQVVEQYGLDELKKTLYGCVKLGRHTEHGYGYVSEHGFSVQYKSSKDAWATVLHLAKKLVVKVEVSFRWQVHKSAAHPGKHGHLVWVCDQGPAGANVPGGVPDYGPTEVRDAKKLPLGPRSYRGRKPMGFVFLCQRHSCTRFKEILIQLCAELHRKHGSDFARVLELRGRSREYFAQDNLGMTSPVEIDESGIFVETNQCADETVKRCHQLLDLFGYQRSDFEVIVA